MIWRGSTSPLIACRSWISRRLGRTRQALAAGCDLALHCNGDPGEMEEVVAAARPISQLTAARLGRGEAMRCGSPPNGFDRKEVEARFDELLAGAGISDAAEQ